MNLFIILLIVVTFFLLLIKLLASLTGRITERMLSQHFRSIERLFVDKQLPDSWSKELLKMAQGRQPLRQRQPWEQRAKGFLLKKIGKLRKFFETCPFVDSQEARELLLMHIDTVKERWEDTDVLDILADYDLAIDAEA